MIQKEVLENLYWIEEKSMAEIARELLTSRKVVDRLFDKYGIPKRTLKQCANTKRRKRYWSSDSNPQTVKALKKYKELEGEIGSLIEERIYSGEHAASITREFGIGATLLRNFLKWKGSGLPEKIKENGQRVNRENRLKASKLAAEKTKGVPLKAISEEAMNEYKSLVDSGAHLAEIRKVLKKKGYGYKKVNQMREAYGKPVKKMILSGKNNGMFGKKPPKGAGIGLSGYVSLGTGREVFFRSSLEMKVFLYLKDNGVDFNLSEERIPYTYSGGERTYCPDYRVGNEVYEIKPNALIDHRENSAKFFAARIFCEERSLKFKVVTEETYDLSKYSKEYIVGLIKSGEIRITSKEGMRKVLRVL
jgi:hypothetical protein